MGRVAAEACCPFFKFNKQKTIFNGTIPILLEIFIASAMHMMCTCMYNPLGIGYVTSVKCKIG